MKKPIKKFPLKNKYKDLFKRKIKTKYLSKSNIHFKYGTFGLRSKESFKITFKEAEALRRLIAFNYKCVKIWFRFVLDVPLKLKASGTRMGSGKGKLKLWVGNVKKGSIFVELDNLPNDYLVKIHILNLALKKISTPLQIVQRLKC